VIRFLDGPAADVALAVRRDPLFLRAVFNPRAKAGPWDALDQLDDAPKPHERIAVYLRIWRRSPVHVKACRRSESGFFADAGYRLSERQPDDATARDAEAWRAWCYAEAVFVRRVGPPRLTEPSEGPARAN
jgi:hypothetical protein